MTTSLEDVRTRLIEEESQFSRRSFAVTDIRVEPGVFCVGDETIRLTDDGLERICQEVKAPYGYVASLEPELQAALLRHHIGRGDLQGDCIELVMRREELVAIQRNSLHQLTSVNVLDAVVEGVGPISLSVHNLALSQDTFVIDLVTDAHHTEVSPGDIIRAGVRVIHSFLGEQATAIEAYVLRLVCRNGLTHRECLSRGTARTRRLPAGRPEAHELQMNQIRRLCVEILQSLPTKLEAFKTLGREHLEVEHVVRRWVERARLSTRTLWPMLHAAWQEEGGRPTAYDAMNALTRVATHSHSLNVRTRRALASLAGILAFRQIHFCPRCFSVLNASAGGGQAT